MAGLNREARVFNSTHGANIADMEPQSERSRLYAEQVIKTAAYKNASPEMQKFIMGSYTGVIDNGGSNLVAAIPVFERDKLSNVVDSSYQYIVSRAKIDDFIQDNHKSLFGEYEFKADKASSLQREGNHFFTNLISHSEHTIGGGRLGVEYETVSKGYNISQTSKQANIAINNMRQKGFVSWDLEAMAGNRMMGPTRYPGSLTEFSFMVYDNKGRLANDAFGGKYNAIVGADSTEIARFKELLSRLEGGTGRRKGGTLVGDYFTHEERVTLERLALAGNAKTEVDYTYKDRGFLRFKSFAGSEDLAIGGHKIDDIKRGIQIYEEAYKLRNDVGKTSVFEFNGRKFNVFGDEAQLLEGLKHLSFAQGGGGKTALGFNAKEFDIRLLKQTVASGKMSNEFKSAISAMFTNNGQGDFDFMHFDALAYARSNIDASKLYSAEERRQLKKLGETQFTQEALTRKATARVLGNIIDKTEYELMGEGVSAHLGWVDTEMLAKLSIFGGLLGEDVARDVAKEQGFNIKDEHMLFINENYRYDDMPAPDKITSRLVGKDDIMYTKSFIDPEKHNLLLTYFDPDTNAVITHDNIVIPESGKAFEDKFNIQTGAQRGTLYKIEGMKKVGPLSEQQKALLNELYPHLAHDDLYTITFSQAYDLDNKMSKFQKTARSRGMFSYTGTIEDIQRAINNNMLALGKYKDGKIDISETKDDVWNYLNPVVQTNDINGVGTIRYKFGQDVNAAGVKEKILEETIQTSNTKIEEDAAARMSRTYSYTKDKKLLDLMHQMDEEVAHQFYGAANVTEAQRKGAIEKLQEEFFDNSVEINKRLLKGETAEAIRSTDAGQKLWDRSFHSTLGFDFMLNNEEEKAGLYFSTLSSQLHRIDVVRENEDFVNIAMGIAEDWSRGSNGDIDTNKAKYIYRQIRKTTHEYLRANALINKELSTPQAQLFAEAAGMVTNASAKAGEYINRFEINLDGFNNIRGETPFTIYLDSSSSDSLANRLAKKVGEKYYKSDEARANLVGDLQNFLLRKGMIRSLEHEEQLNYVGRINGWDYDFTSDYLVGSGDSAATASEKLIKHMRYTRELNASVGHRAGTANFGLNYKLGKVFTKDSYKDFVSDIVSNYNKNGFEFFNPKDPKGNETKASYLADILVDNHLFSDPTKGTKHEGNLVSFLMENGYSEKDANTLTNIRNIRKNDARKYISKILSTIGDIGGGVSLSDTGSLSVIFGDTSYDLELISSKFEQGQFIDRIGSKRVSLGHGIFKFGYGDTAHFKETSSMGRYFSNLEWSLKYAKNRVLYDREDPAESIRRAVSKFYNDIRGDSPTPRTIGANSRFDQFRYSIEDVYKNLDLIRDRMLKDPTLRDSKGILKQILMNVEPGTGKYKIGNKTFDVIGGDELNIINANWIPMLNALKGVLHEGEHNLDAFDPNAKQIYKGIASLKDGNINFLSEFSDQGEKRHPERFLDARLNARADAVNEILKLADPNAPQDTLVGIKGIGNVRQKDISALSGIRTNATVMTADMAATLPEANSFREIRMKVLNADMDLLNEKTREALGNILRGEGKLYSFDQFKGRYSQADYDIVKRLFLEEGHAYMHGQVYDRIFNDMESLQKIEFAFGKTSELGKDELLYDLNHHVASIPIFDKSTHMFKYGEGTYVNEGENLIHFVSQGRAIPRPAKYSGLLKFGYFDVNNNLMSEEKISNILGNKMINGTKLPNILEKGTVYEQQKAIYDKMKELGYTGYFYLQSETAGTYGKFGIAKEKNMTFSLIESTGAVDTRVNQVLTDLGFKNVKVAGLEENRVLNIDLIDSITNAESSTGDFWKVASYRYQKTTGQTLTQEKYQSILSSAGFSSGNASRMFKDAIMDERYRTSELLMRLLEESGLKKVGESIHQIADNREGQMKHKDAVVIEQQINELFEANLERVELEAKAKGIKNKRKIVDKALEDTAKQFSKYVTPSEYGNNGDWTQNIKWSDLFDIDVDKQALVQKGKISAITPFTREQMEALGVKYSGHFRDAKFIRDGKSVFKDVGEVFTVAARQLEYYENEKFGGDTVKASQRTITNLEQFRFSDYGLSDVREFLAKRNEKFGLNDRFFEDYIEGVKDGRSVNFAAIDQIKKRLFTNGKETLAGYIGKTDDGKIGWAVDTEKIRKFVSNHNIFNGDVDKGTELITSLIEETSERTGAKTFKDQAVLDIYGAWSSAMAASYNMGDTSEETIKKAGFEIVKMQDLLFDDDGRIKNAPVGRNLLIDLNDDYYGTGNELISGLPNNSMGKKNFLAVSYTPKNNEYLDKKTYLGQTHLKLKNLQERMQEFRDHIATNTEAMANGTYSPSERSSRIEYMKELIQNVHAAQYNQFMSKKGIMKNVTTAYMADGMYNAASGHDLTGLEKWELEDVSLKELLDKALEGTTREGHALSELEIGGINLLSEAAKNENAIQLNYTILSLDKMNRVYNQRFDEFQKALVNAGLGEDQAKWALAGIKEDTLAEVQTKGVSGISYREPTQYFGSVTQRQIFFNDIAKGNQAIGNFTGANLRKEDFDSDKVLNAIHKENAAITIDGKEAFMEIDSAMYNVLKNRGIEVRLLDEGAEERFKNYFTSQIYLGAGQAQRYRRLLEDVDKEYAFDSLSDAYIRDKEGHIGIFNEMLSKHVSYEDANKYYSTYLEQIAAIDTQGKYESLNDKRLAVLRSLDAEASSLNIANVSTVSDLNTDNALSEEAKNLMHRYNALKFGVKMDWIDADVVAATGQSYGVGAINSYTQSINTVVQRALSAEGGAEAANAFFKERGYEGLTAGLFSEQMSLVTLALQEGSMTPKNEEAVAGYFNEDKLTTVKNTFDRLIKINNYTTSTERDEIKKEVSDLIYNVLEQRADKEIYRLGGITPSPLQALEINGVQSTELKKFYLNALKAEKTILEDGREEITAFRTIGDSTSEFLVDAMMHGADMRKSAQVPGAKGAVDKVTAHHLAASMSGENNIGGVMASVLNAVSRKLGIVSEDAGDVIRELGEVGIKDEMTMKEEASQMATTAMRASEDIVSNNITRVMRNAEKMAAEGTGKMGGNTLLGAAIGLAGGLIISGFANDPKAPLQPSVPPQQPMYVPVAAPPMSSTPQPTDMLAAGADAQMLSAQPISLADSNLNVMRGSKKKSYVINISGDTSRSRTQAMDAINSAMYRSGTYQNDGNGNINMAVNNSYRSSLTQNQVDRMVAAAMGA